MHLLFESGNYAIRLRRYPAGWKFEMMTLITRKNRLTVHGVARVALQLAMARIMLIVSEEGIVMLFGCFYNISLYMATGRKTGLTGAEFSFFQGKGVISR